MSYYHINVFYSEEDQAYVADIPDLPLCSAFGDTPESAVHEVSFPHYSGHLDCWRRPTEKGVQDGHEVSTRVPAASSGVSASG